MGVKRPRIISLSVHSFILIHGHHCFVRLSTDPFRESLRVGTLWEGLPKLDGVHLLTVFTHATWRSVYWSQI